MLKRRHLKKSKMVANALKLQIHNLISGWRYFNCARFIKTASMQSYMYKAIYFILFLWICNKAMLVIWNRQPLYTWHRYFPCLLSPDKCLIIFRWILQLLPRALPVGFFYLKISYIDKGKKQHIRACIYSVIKCHILSFQTNTARISPFPPGKYLGLLNSSFLRKKQKWWYQYIYQKLRKIFIDSLRLDPFIIMYAWKVQILAFVKSSWTR